MGEIGWKFPGSDGGIEAGFNDSGIETYAGKPLEHLAREVIQNSLDAKKVSSNKPVIVAFQMENIPSSDFPGRDDILDVMEQCLQENRDGQKVKEFFRIAIEILRKPKIPCLKVSDYNTTGLRDGDDYRGGQWYRLVKTTGRSDHGNEIAGGSFGIGKNAPFAVSSLRTVFYSTRYEENSAVIHRAQGKAILVSHQLKKNNYSQAIGFYGVKDNCDKITGKHIPKLLQRDEENGTTLLIPGFNETENWQERITAVVISNYFYAIHKEDLRVEIKGAKGSKDIVINAQTLPKIFAKTRGEDVATAYAYYRAIIKNKPKTENLKKLGKCFLWIMLEKDCDQSVAILRRGMKITNNYEKLNNRWVLHEDFVAVCICGSKEGNRLLRAMENPAHDAFEPARLGGDSKRGEDALKELTRWIRKEIRNVAKNEAESVIQVPEMGKIIGMEDDDFDGEGTEKGFDGGSHVLKKPTKIKPIIDSEPPDQPIDIDDDEEEDAPGTGGTGGTGTGGTGMGTGGTGTGGSPGVSGPSGDPPSSPPVRAMKIGATRVVSLAEKNGTEKLIIFTPQETGKGELSLKIAGDSFVEKINISAVIEGKNATLNDGKVLLRVEKGTRVWLTVRLAQPNDAALLVALGTPTKASS